MKKNKSFGISLILTIFLISCGGGNIIIDGGILGELPTIANKTVVKLKKLQDDNDEKTKDKIKTIKKEAKSEMTEYIQSKGAFAIPCEQKTETDLFLITEVKLTKAHFQSGKSLKSSLVMTATCEAAKEINGNFSLFLRFVNSDGKVLDGWCTLNYFGRPLKKLAPGEKMIFNGSFTGSVEKLIKVKNAINISREEWNELRRKKD